ncbi:MAG: aldo/keto reductase [Candidatus Competibacteraceae bacterium]|nr:aldo/keto reductase [Candidatus Competibacteraceae bacterium]MCB1812800.1 aldo/keto reductase [Candidatus Competibacteraceae bacterium]
MRTFLLSSGIEMPAFGLGTWHMGERASQRRAEADALRYALDLGIRLIDTAEMYGEGGAEEIIGEALQGRRADAIIVSKVYPHNASRQGVIDACERSLRRLGTDVIDLYLLHWRGSIPLAETFDGFARLRDAGKIRDFGVSNFDYDDLQEVAELGIETLGANQVLYNPVRREADWAVLPWCREHNVPLMAYCPLNQGGRLLTHRTLQSIAERHQATTAQIVLAWLLHQDVVVIPKSSRPERIKENVAATQLVLSDDDTAELEHAFPAPNKAVRLGMV